MLVISHIDVRYPDCDPMGIVHHSVYPLWYEIARMDFFEAIGFGYTDMQKLGINPPMVNLNLNYGAPVHYPGSVTVRSSCSLCAGKKYRLHYAVYRENESHPCATATSFHIWTGPDMKSLDMSTLPDIYEKLQHGVTRPAVLILAGGASSRMGQDKAAMEWNGTSMLQHAADFWHTAVPDVPVYVAVGTPQHAVSLPDGCIPVYDLIPGKGPLSGMHAAFSQLDESAFFVSAVDMPLLHQDALSTLEQNMTHCEDACIFRDTDGRIEPLFGCYRKSVLPALEAALQENRDYSLRSILNHNLDCTLVPLPEKNWLANVNTPDDIAGLPLHTP